MLKNSPAWFKYFILAILVLGGLLYGQVSEDELIEDELIQEEIVQDEIVHEVSVQRQTGTYAYTLPLESQWYRSNASGMMLDSVFSRATALRNEYALSVSPAARSNIPIMLLDFYDNSFSVELRTLFHNLQKKREQWIFRDSHGSVRLNASGPDGFFQREEFENERAFIEIYDENSNLIEEHLYSGGSEIISLFAYSSGFLIRAEIWMRDPPPENPVENETDIENETEDENDDEDDHDEDEHIEILLPEPIEAGPWGPGLSPPDITDIFRYTRSASLRAIERIFHSGYEGDSRRRIPFPGIGPIFPNEPLFDSPGIAHSSEFLDDVIIPPGGRVIYNTDNRGRVLSERRYDEEGELIGELINDWSGDRLLSVSWVSGNDEWAIEYDYDDDGNRIMERNINRGILERTVRSDGDREVEELYMNGIVVLRAIWEEGRKISEERIRNR